mmetsp:Transcript_29665/g.47781  ORF Transcript_29665/g.47781 Transcript_29665/m.47781 type:complete len:466 (+) Transcript_29665:58-1455(+)
MQVSPATLPGPRFRRHASAMGVSGYQTQALAAKLSPPTLKAHVVSGSVYSNGHSCASLGHAAASPSSPVLARTVSPLHTASRGQPALARAASPLKGQQGYVTRTASTANSSVAPPGGASQPSLAQRRHISPRTQPNSVGSPPVPGLLQPSPTKSVTPQVMRRSSCPPPVVRSGSNIGSSNRVPSGIVMAKVVTSETLSSPAHTMRQMSAVPGITASTLQAPAVSSTGAPNIATVSRSATTGKPVSLQAASPHRPARLSTGALTARSINGRGASTTSLGDVASPRALGQRALLPSTRQSNGGLPPRSSPRETSGAARRAVSREEMISSGRLRQTIAGSPRAHRSNGSPCSGVLQFVSDPLLVPTLERREAPTHGVGGLRSTDSSTASVMTLPGPVAESNDLSQDLNVGESITDVTLRLSDTSQRQQDMKDPIDMSPRSALTADVPTEPGTDLQSAELLSPRTEPPC